MGLIHEDGHAPAEPVIDAEPAGLLERLAAIDSRLSELNHRESVIDRLLLEREELRRGERRAMLEPVVADLIRLHDGLAREACMAASWARPAAGAALLQSFVRDVEEILDRCGIEVIGGQPGDLHQVGEHRAVGVKPTDLPERHNTIAEVVGLGFRDREAGRVRRPLLAHFHKYQE